MKTKRVLRTIAAVTAFSGATAYAWDTSENQIWLQGSAGLTVSETVALKVAEQIRFKDGDECLRQTDLQALYRLGGGWSLAGTARYIDKERSCGAWEPDYMALFDVCKKQTVGWAELKGRARVTYTDKYDIHLDPWEIRLRADGGLAKGWTSLKLKPYLANEVMYDLSDSNFYRNRAYVGVKASPLKKVSTDVYLMQELKESASGRWNEFYVIGVSAGLKF